MYEVTLIVNGRLETTVVEANNSSLLFNIITNMYTGRDVQIINYRRI